MIEDINISEWLENDSSFLYFDKRTTRVGATTYFTKFFSDWAKKNNKKVLILEPTNAIIQNTVIPANPDIYWLKSNEIICQNDKIKSRAENWIYTYGYFPSSFCRSCELKDSCERFCEIDISKNIFCSTYAKAYFDERILEQIKPDLIMMDEYQWIDSFQINKRTKEDLELLSASLESKGIYQVAEFVDCVRNEEDLILCDISPSLLMTAIDLLKGKDKDTLRWITQNYNSYKKFQYFNNSIIPAYESPIESILRRANTKTFIISMSKFQSWMVDGFVGEGENIKMDMDENEKSQLIVCDCANRPLLRLAKGDLKFYNRNYTEEMDCLEVFLRNLSEFVDLKKTLIFTPNIKIKEDIEKRLPDLVECVTYEEIRDGSENMMLDYARSETSTGIEIGRRVGVMINLPWTPENAFKDKELVSGIENESMRVEEISYTLKNCLGRFKDPHGKVPSCIFIYGSRKEDLEYFLPDKKEVVEIKQSHGEILSPDISQFMEYWMMWNRVFPNRNNIKKEPLELTKLFEELNIYNIHRHIFFNHRKYLTDTELGQIFQGKRNLWRSLRHNKEILYLFGIKKDQKRYKLISNDDLPKSKKNSQIWNQEVMMKVYDKFVYSL